MDYKLGDILVCTELFSTDKNRISWDAKYQTNRQFTGRVICEGDTYKVEDLDFVTEENIYIKEIPIPKSVIYAETIPITIEQADKYFKCKRIERKRKLDKLNDIT